MFGLIRQDRDLRVDFFRGLALWIIFVNHIPGNWLGLVTPRNYVLADAAETFVLLAGYGAGLAYGRLMDRQGWFFAVSRVLGRVFTLYVAHIFLLVVFTAQVGYSADRLDAHVYLDELQLDPFAREPYRALLEALHSHTSVILQPEFDDPRYSGINPYALGFAMMEDIERICRDPTEEDREWFPDFAGCGDPDEDFARARLGRGAFDGLQDFRSAGTGNFDRDHGTASRFLSEDGHHIRLCHPCSHPGPSPPR